MPEEFISLNEYMHRYKMGYDVVLRLIHDGKIEAHKVGSRYKIKVGGDTVSREMYEKAIKKIAELETIVKTMQNIANQVEV